MSYMAALVGHSCQGAAAGGGSDSDHHRSTSAVSNAAPPKKFVRTDDSTFAAVKAPRLRQTPAWRRAMSMQGIATSVGEYLWGSVPTSSFLIGCIEADATALLRNVHLFSEDNTVLLYELCADSKWRRVLADVLSAIRWENASIDSREVALAIGFFLLDPESFVTFLPRVWVPGNEWSTYMLTAVKWFGKDDDFKQKLRCIFQPEFQFFDEAEYLLRHASKSLMPECVLFLLEAEWGGEYILKTRVISPILRRMSNTGAELYVNYYKYLLQSNPPRIQPVSWYLTRLPLRMLKNLQERGLPVYTDVFRESSITITETLQLLRHGYRAARNRYDTPRFREIYGAWIEANSNS
jgi:hypothetical protein